MLRPRDEPARRLDSWKEIAAYLQRDVRTVQRWEQKEGLPVHRYEHGSRASVFAESEELEQWLAYRRTSPEEPPPPPGLRRLWLAGGAVLLLAAAGGYWLYRRAAAPGVVQLRQILRREDIDAVGAPSRDGRFLPYRTTDAQMFLLDLTTSKTRSVMKPPGSGSYVTFAASPDGSQVAYDLEMLDGPAELHVVSADGSGDRLLFRDPQYGVANPRSWSPDGKQIAAMLWKSDGTREVAAVDAATKAIHVLHASRKNPANPQFSPDGRYVAFNESGDVMVVPASGGAPIAAVSNPARDSVIGWAADGQLVFASDRSGQTDVYRLKLREGRPAAEPELVRQDLRVNFLGVTRRGSLLYARSLEIQELYSGEIADDGSLGSGPTPLTGTRFVGQNREPDYSRDGRFLAYISGPTDSPDTAIRIRTLASGAERAIPLPIPHIDQMRWYPDGTALLLRGKDGEGRYGLFRLQLDPIDLQPVLLKGVPSHMSVNATVSPDGKYLFYLALPNQDLQILMRLDLRTGTAKEFYRPSGRFLRMYALSPDGTQLALQEREQHPDKTFVDILGIRPVNGGPLRIIDRSLRFVRASGALAWSADGNSLFYMHPDPAALQRDDLLRVPVNGGSPSTLAASDIITRVAPNPDARHVLWQASGRAWEVSSIDNLLAGER